MSGMGWNLEEPPNSVIFIVRNRLYIVRLGSSALVPLIDIPM